MHITLRPQPGLLLFEKVLLRSDDGARATYAQPGDRLGRRKLEVFHHVAADESACATQAGFAVNGDCSVRLLGDLEKLLDNGVTGRAAVDEEHVVVLEAAVGEALGIVDFLVETYDRFHVVLAEVVHVGLGRM